METIKAILKAGASSAMTLEEIILQEIDDWNLSNEKQWMQTGYKYYRNETDIKDRKRMTVGEGGGLQEETNLANNKLIHGFIRKLVDQKVGYLLSKPLSIQTDNEPYADLLNETFNKSFLRLLQNVGKETINKGRGWLHVYYDEDGQLSFKKIPSEEIIPLWKDAAHTILDAVIRAYDIEVYEGKTKKTITKVEFWDTKGVKRYVIDDGKLIPDVETGDSSHFSVIKGEEQQPLNWERVPFICFKYNNEEQPLVQLIKSLVDDYDNKKSDNSNNLEDLPNSTYVIKDYDGEDLGEFRRNLSIFRVIKVTSEGGVDTINLEIDTEAFKTHMEMNRKDIYEFGRGVDTQSEKFGNSPSGIALKFLYADLDMDANDMEMEFQASLEQLLWFIDQHIANTTTQDFSNEQVDFIFNRDIVINETDTITNAKNSVGIISDETIINNHPWVTDSQDELDRVKKQREEDLQQMQDYNGMGEGNENE
ncbi:phage portal protein [Chengkuizengella sp. SCS-71B]|uniref:phage portal protein n=1 Tax=Chengkuizengella sp. SCS-71B TaxID=3115290 RepID=UPI0032C24491